MKRRLSLLLSRLKVIMLEEVSSTNDYLKEKYVDLRNFTVVRADYQTNGRGQFDRTWESEDKKNVLFSILFKNVTLKHLEVIKQTVIESLIILLKTYDIKGKFKSPNDIYVDDKKILGILIETKISAVTFDYVIVGVGINVNQEKFNTDNATSILEILNKEVSVSQVFKKAIKIFFKNYNEKMKIVTI